MAFGAHYSTDLYLDPLTPHQFLVLASDTAEQLGWSILHVSDAGLIAVTAWSAVSRKIRITIRITGDKVNIRSESTGNEMFDWGRNKRNVRRFTDIFYEQRANFSPEGLAQKYEGLKPKLVPPDQDSLSQPADPTDARGVTFISFFLPRPGYYVTPILVYINIGVFLLMALSGVDILSPTSRSLIKWGANIRFYTMEGEWWRLITCCFVHIGIIHLLMNMYALIIIGLLLEPLLGTLRFAVAYLLTGIASSLLSLYWHDLSVSVGASGAIFGMYGVFLAMLTTNVVGKMMRTIFLTTTLIFVGYNLAYGLKGGIDNAGHIGGLLSGIVIGYLFYPGLKQPQKPALLYTSIGAASLFTLLVSIIIIRMIPDDIIQYEKKMRSFSRMEHSAIVSINKLSSDSPREQWLSTIKDSGIYYWNRNLQLLNEVQRLNLPAPLIEHTTLLIQYCDLRLASYNYLYRKVQSNMGTDPDSMPIYNSQINALIAALKSKN